MARDRIEITGPGLAEMTPVPLDDLTLGLERVLDDWRDRVRAIDIERFECVMALTVVDEGDHFALLNPVQVGKPAAWLLGLSLLLTAVVQDTLKPTQSRKQLLKLLRNLAESQSDFLDDIKHGKPV